MGRKRGETGRNRYRLEFSYFDRTARNSYEVEGTAVRNFREVVKARQVRDPSGFARLTDLEEGRALAAWRGPQHPDGPALEIDPQLAADWVSLGDLEPEYEEG